MRNRLANTNILSGFEHGPLLFLRAQLERSMSKRQALFISHASPEDNAFTIWLGAKLAAAGYEVWADILRLTGCDDWQRKLEDALRNRACKVLSLRTRNRSTSKGSGTRSRLHRMSPKRSAIRGSSFGSSIPLKPGPFGAPSLSPAVCALRAKQYRACPIYRFQSWLFFGTA